MPSPRSFYRNVTLYIGLTLIGAILLLPVYESDPNFVLYRFVTELRTSGSLRYGMVGGNPTTYPLTPLLITLFSSVGIDPQLGGWLVALTALSLSGILLVHLIRRGWIVGVVLLFSGLAQPSPAAMLMLLFGLGAVTMANLQRWEISGILAGLAICADPCAMPLLMILGFGAALAGWSAVRRFLVPGSVILLLILGGVFVVYRPAGWIGLSAPEIGVALPLMALVGLFLKGQSIPRPTAVLAAWGALSATLALLNGSLPNSAFLPGVIGLAALLAESNLGKVIFIGAAAVDLALGTAAALPFNTPDNDGLPDAVQAGQWIAANLRPENTLVTDRFHSVGTLGFYARTRLINLNQDPVDPSLLVRFAPDGLVLSDSHPGIPLDLLNNRYARVQQYGDMAVYVRVVNWSGWNDHGVDINFSAALDRDDLRLVSVAIGDTLHPGDLARVRLDWMLRYKPTFKGDFEIKLDLLDSNFAGFAPGVLDKYPASIWTAGSFSTYHVIPLPTDAREGQASLYLNLSLRAANVGTLKIAEVNIKR